MSNLNPELSTSKSVTIYSASYKTDYHQIATKHEFFTGDIIVKVDHVEGMIEFTKPSLGYIGKTNVVGINRGFRLIRIKQANMPHGKFEIDEEESNEDKVVVYFK